MGSLYAQDNINLSGMILNFGLRLDYWFPGKYVDDTVSNPDVVTIPDEIEEIMKKIHMPGLMVPDLRQD